MIAEDLDTIILTWFGGRSVRDKGSVSEENRSHGGLRLTVRYLEVDSIESQEMGLM